MQALWSLTVNLGARSSSHSHLPNSAGQVPYTSDHRLSLSQPWVKYCVTRAPLLYFVNKCPLGDISSELYGDWLWDENFKFCLIFTHFSRFSPFSGYIWWNNTLSSLENFSLNSILFFLFLMSHPDNGGFLKIAQKRDSISKKTSFCIMVINTDHQESWFLSVGHPLCALR